MAIDPKKKFAAEMRKYVPIIKEAHSQGLNEAATKLHLSQFFSDVLGYNLFTDVVPEYGVRGKYADYAIKIDDDIRLLVEVKQVSLKLKERHLYQLANYAASEGIEWCLLTNSAVFELYCIEFEKPISWHLVFTTDLIDENLQDTVEKLWYLTKRSLRRNEIEKYRQKQISLSPVSIAKAILTYDVVRVIRRSLRHSTGFSVSEDELGEVIQRKVIRERISNEIGAIRIRQPVKKKSAEAHPAQQEESVPAEILKNEQERSEGEQAEPSGDEGEDR